MAYIKSFQNTEINKVDLRIKEFLDLLNIILPLSFCTILFLTKHNFCIKII